MSLVLRITAPLGALAGARGIHLVERNALLYRRTWIVLVSGFVEPLFYLLGLGFGLGRLVGEVAGPDGSPIPYAVFVAPALLASSSMNGAILESTYNVFHKLRYEKLYESMLRTPLSTADIAVGEIGFALLRGALYALGFLAVVLALGLMPSPLGLLMVPAALLEGLAFAAVGMAATTWMRTWQDFDLIQLVTLPLFLFSATFYPVSTYPPALQLVVEWTPLYQAVELMRMLATGHLAPVALVHVAYLAAMGVGGLWITSRRLDHLLRK
jgi:lipooligosaccharide transport system permease protein